MTRNRDDLLSAYALADRQTPRVRMNLVASLDGAATLRGRSGGLGSSTDQLLMDVLRTQCDLLMVGAGTIRAEGYGGVAVSLPGVSWRRTHALTEQPRIAVVSRALDLSPQHPFFTEAVTRPLVVTCASAPAGTRAALEGVADIVVAGDEGVDLAQALRDLSQRGLRQVLCEGGPHLFGSLLDEGLVDELCLTLSPHLVGGDAGRIVRGAGESARPFRMVHTRQESDWLFLRYAAEP